MITFTIEITGTAPLLMHNGRLADPLEPAAQQVAKLTGKQKKTEEDYRDLAQVEFFGGIYHDSELGPYLPGDNITRCLIDAARMNRQGKKIECGVFITTTEAPLIYKGPRALQDLWSDANFQHRKVVSIGRKKIARCRPMFRKWSCSAEGVFDPNMIDLADFEGAVQRAGAFIGLGDWRPRYGRFNATFETTGNLAA